MAFGTQWNPWHGCHKVSEACRNCFMMDLDASRGLNGNIVVKNEKMFDFPVQRCKNGTYKYKGYYISTCFTSDFFIEEADQWRPEIWEMIKERHEVKFLIFTKRPERIAMCLPPDWGNGWHNVLICVTAETQEMANIRVPILMNLPLKWRGIAVTPTLERVNLEPWLETGMVDEVLACGENYYGKTWEGDSRVIDFENIKYLSEQCKRNKVTFKFQETGKYLMVNGRVHKIPNDKKIEQAKLAKLDKTYSRKQREELRINREYEACKAEKYGKQMSLTDYIQTNQ